MRIFKTKSYSAYVLDCLLWVFLINGLEKQLCLGEHPDRTEKGHDNGAERTEFLFGKKNCSEIFLTIHLIIFVN